MAAEALLDYLEMHKPPTQHTFIRGLWVKSTLGTQNTYTTTLPIKHFHSGGMVVKDQAHILILLHI